MQLSEIKPGTRFTAVRKWSNKPVLGGFVFTAKYVNPGVIICRDKTIPRHSDNRNIQLFTRHFTFIGE